MIRNALHSREMPLLAGAALLAAGLAGCLFMLRRDGQQRMLAQRLLLVRASAGLSVAAVANPREDAALRTVALVGRLLSQSGLLPAATLGQLSRTLTTSGLPGSNALAIFIGAKVLGCGTLLLLSWLLVTGFGIHAPWRTLLPVAGAMTGLLAPDYILRRSRSSYLARVEAGIPDALDMLVICTEAGLGLEPGIERVADEMVHAHVEVARELRITANEMRLITDRGQVLANLGIRTGLESLRRLGTTLNQATQFGTPMGQALRTLAVEMRQESMTRYEARAARLPVMLTFPMILFILPCIFIVVVGPAVLQISKVFGKGH
nr:type II secretion system F family protein [uncultured Lichenicoccus sp.]